jgi:hypothetical protein
MNRLIEDYLRTRGVRYFRGHHDDEYFYLVDFVVGADRGRLNVHLEVCDADRGGLQASITPDRYYPAQSRQLLEDLVDRCNAGTPAVGSVIHDSCDPMLVGVQVRGHSRPADSVASGDFVEAAVACSVDLFGTLAALAQPARRGPETLRDAG